MITSRSLADIVTIFVFVLVGANLPFHALGEEIVPALAVVAVLLLVARPVTVAICMLPDRRSGWSRAELAFVCWTRETGVVPAALVGVLAALSVPNGDLLASVVALAILVTLWPCRPSRPRGWPGGSASWKWTEATYRQPELWAHDPLAVVVGDTKIARMCGIAGLFGKSSVVTEHLGEHLGAMLSELNDRGPDSAGVAIYRDPAPAGASKVSLFSPDPRYEWGAVRDGLAAAFGGDPEPEVRASHAVFVVDADAERAEAVAARPPSRAADHERRRDDRDLQGGGPPLRLRRALRARRRAGQPRAGPHAHGDREPGHDPALASVLHRPRPLPGAQRIAVEPQPPAPRAAARGRHASRPTTTPRWRPAT